MFWGTGANQNSKLKNRNSGNNNDNRFLGRRGRATLALSSSLRMIIIMIKPDSFAINKQLSKYYHVFKVINMFTAYLRHSFF
ncbi:hypothetical protein SAMD00079811_76770 (plasmid) [Scytonema sp. HK-05]|nr:hypothetical protein SAMD00079811_76770 [Scytonema sp. HK-05]